MINLKNRKMSNKILTVIVFSFIIFACEKNESTVKSDIYSYEYSAFSKIKTTFNTLTNEYTLQDSVYIDTTIYVYSEVLTGDNYVFKYKHTYPDDVQIADDEYSETILIEIPTNLDAFTYEGDELNNLNTAFEYDCYCPMLGLIKADSGTISGVRIDDSNWEIELNLRFTGEQGGNTNVFQKRFSISETFKKE